MADTPFQMPPIDQLKGRPLGRVLIKMGKLRRSQVHAALEQQKEKRGPIGQILVELGHIEDSDLQLALAAQMGMEPIDLEQDEIPPEVIAMIPVQTAQTY